MKSTALFLLILTASAGAAEENLRDDPLDAPLASELAEPQDYEDWSREKLMLERQRQEAPDGYYDEFTPQDEVDATNEDLRLDDDY